MIGPATADRPDDQGGTNRGTAGGATAHYDPSGSGVSWVANSRTRPRAAQGMFAWDVRGGESGWGGVTDDRNAAMRHVHRALHESGPGGWGTVRHVALDPLGRVRYIHLSTVAEAWRDEATGAVVWRDA